MTDPITPPPELVQQWWAEETYDPFGMAVTKLATRAAQWGADQELEACCEWFSTDVVSEVVDVVSDLRTARRPKPLSLKEQALHAAKLLFSDSETGACAAARDTIRRALEALPDNTDPTSQED